MISSIRKLLDPVFPLFTPLESSLLYGVASECPDPDIGAALSSRLRRINSIARDPLGREICLYTIILGKVIRPSNSTIIAPTPEWLLCRVTFRTRNHPKKITAKLWVVSGQFAIVEFSENVRGIRKEGAQILAVEFTDIRNSGEAAMPAPAGDAVTRLLGSWARDLRTDNVRPPLQEELRAARRAQLDFALPGDYLELVALCDGFDISKARVLGLAEAREVILPSADYLVLAEVEDARFLAIVGHEKIAKFALIDHEDIVLQKYGSSFIEALRRAIAYAEETS